LSFTISARKICKRFNREWILRNFDYTLESGNVYAVTGPNGSGKSTLLQLLWGQLPPSSGSLTYKNDGAAIALEDIYKHVSIATPYMDLIDEFTLLEQLRFHFKLKPARDNLSVEQVLDAMSLNNAKDKSIANFSSGMKQRVKLGIAFFTQADLLFLDEPGTNLDEPSFDWYLRQLQNIAPQCLTIIASNQASEYPSNALKIDIMTYK
jgi:ABC-type multidrug transport system ATPase subunit